MTHRSWSINLNSLPWITETDDPLRQLDVLWITETVEITMTNDKSLKSIGLLFQKFVKIVGSVYVGVSLLKPFDKITMLPVTTFYARGVLF